MKNWASQKTGPFQLLNLRRSGGVNGRMAQMKHFVQVGDVAL